MRTRLEELLQVDLQRDPVVPKPPGDRGRLPPGGGVAVHRVLPLVHLFGVVVALGEALVANLGDNTVMYYNYNVHSTVQY